MRHWPRQIRKTGVDLEKTSSTRWAASGRCVPARPTSEYCWALPSLTRRMMRQSQGIAGQAGGAGDRSLAETMKREKMTLAFRTTRSGDIEVNYLAVPFVALLVDVSGWDLTSGCTQTVAAAAAISRAKARRPRERSIHRGSQSPWRAVRDGGAFRGPAQDAPASYPTLLMMLRMGTGFGDIYSARGAEMILPPLDKLLASLTPAGSVAWSDAAGLHYRTMQPVPRSLMLETEYNIMAGQGAVMVSVLLPALNRRGSGRTA